MTSELVPLVAMRPTFLHCDRGFDEKKSDSRCYNFFLGSRDVVIKQSAHFLGLVARELAFFTATSTTGLTAVKSNLFVRGGGIAVEE